MDVLPLILIFATLPITVNPMPVSEALREAAKQAGCERPLVEMKWLGRDHRLEIEVSCPGGDDGRLGN